MGIASSAFNSQIKQPQNSDKMTDMLTLKDELKIQNEPTELRSESILPNDKEGENTERKQALEPLDNTIRMKADQNINKLGASIRCLSEKDIPVDDPNMLERKPLLEKAESSKNSSRGDVEEQIANEFKRIKDYVSGADLLSIQRKVSATNPPPEVNVIPPPTAPERIEEEDDTETVIAEVDRKLQEELTIVVYPHI